MTSFWCVITTHISKMVFEDLICYYEVCMWGEDEDAIHVRV